MEELARNVANLRIGAESTAHQDEPERDSIAGIQSADTVIHVHYKIHLDRALATIEEQDQICYQIMQFTTAKGAKNAIYHSLFNQVSAGKLTVLQKWFQTGVIPTRNGLKHWAFDARKLRNAMGSTLLHVACDVSMARGASKLGMIEFLLNTVGFDVNVRDLLGKTPLHIAALNGFVEIVQCLIERGADVMLQDRSGLRPLALVKTLSRPHEDIVPILAMQQAQKTIPFALWVSKEQAIVSTVFLRFFSSYIDGDCRRDMESQVLCLLQHLESVSTKKRNIDFDGVLVRYVPILFENTTRFSSQLIHLMKPNTFRDPTFISELRLEAYTHQLSLATSSVTNSTSNSLWIGMLLRLAQYVGDQAELSTQQPLIEDSARAMELPIEVRASNQSLKASSDPGRHTRLSSHPFRQSWNYAILFRAASKSFPTRVHVESGESFIKCVHDVSGLIPLNEPLLIEKKEYVACNYDSTKRIIVLDRPYEGQSASSTQIYLRGSEWLHHSYIAVKCIWEREPGNNYDNASHEQELFLDYQFLPPHSDYEVAAKVGPFDDAKEARDFAAVWKQQCRASFMEKSCQSQSPSCKLACLQLQGTSPCTETMISIAKQLATKRLGGATFCQVQPARALIEKLESGDDKSRCHLADDSI